MKYMSSILLCSLGVILFSGSSFINGKSYAGELPINLPDGIEADLSHANFNDDPKLEKNTVILDREKAGRFVDSLDEISLFSAALEKEHGNGDLFAIKSAIQHSKSFSPYKHAVKILKEKYPNDYKTLGEITTKYEFESQEDWAETADAVIIAYFYIQQKKSGNVVEMDMRSQLTPEMMAMVPPEAMVKIERALAMAKAINDVPEENEEIVRDLVPALEVAMRKNL